MNAAAWRGLRRHWGLRPSASLLWQSHVAGPLFSSLQRLQLASAERRRSAATLAGAIVILGYWRSGTTLLHEYLCLDRRFGFARTYACMNPHHFVLTRAAPARGAATQRPMDAVSISADSPQEDEFALLGLGARSPYEALLVPAHLQEALLLADPEDLAAHEREHWRQTFSGFIADVSALEGGRPLILKSPTHGYRIGTLRTLLPDVRFIVIVRAPGAVFESAVHMWRSLFALYALDTVPPEDATRRAVLEDRPRFEAKLAQGLSSMPTNRVTLVRYEELVSDPVAILGQVYGRLELDGFEAVEPEIRREWRKRSSYVARAAAPAAPWDEALRTSWASIFERYGYPRDC